MHQRLLKTGKRPIFGTSKPERRLSKPLSNAQVRQTLAERWSIHRHVQHLVHIFFRLDNGIE